MYERLAVVMNPSIHPSIRLSIRPSLTMYSSFFPLPTNHPPAVLSYPFLPQYSSIVFTHVCVARYPRIFLYLPKTTPRSIIDILDVPGSQSCFSYLPSYTDLE